MRTRTTGLLCGVSLLWGSEWILTPLLAEVAAPFAATATVLLLSACLLAAALLCIRCSLSRQARAAPAKISLRQSVTLSVLMFAAPTILLLFADRYGIAGWTPLLYSAMPLCLGFAADAWSGAMVLAIGAALVVLGGAVSLDASKWPGILLAGAAVALQSFALRFIAAKLRGSSRQALLQSLAVQCAFAGLVLAVCSALFDPRRPVALAAQWNTAAAFALLLLSALGTVLAYGVFYWALTNTALLPHQAAVTQWLQVSVLFAEGAVFGRSFPDWTVLGAAAILLGCAFFVLRNNPSPDRTSIAFANT